MILSFKHKGLQRLFEEADTRKVNQDHVKKLLRILAALRNISMKKPPHPGEHFLEDYIKPLEMTITEAAELLDVDRKSLSRLVNGKASISTLMALRLSIAFPNTKPQFWMRLQANYDLAQERENPLLKTVQQIWNPATQSV